LSNLIVSEIRGTGTKKGTVYFYVVEHRKLEVGSSKKEDKKAEKS